MRFLARPAEGGRPEELLAKHLASVAERARRNALRSAAQERKRASELAWLCGVAHDFGKYTTYFQDKLPPKEVPPLRQEYSHHAFISALLGAFVAQRRYPEEPKAAILVYLAIHRHHGHLITPSEILPRKKDLRDAPSFGYLSSGLRRELVGVEAQMQNIREEAHRAHVISEMRDLAVPEAEEFIAYREWWDIMPVLRSTYRGLLNEADATGHYWRELLLFSSLIDADKHISAGAEAQEEPSRARIPPTLVEDYIHRLKESASPSSSVTAKRLAQVRDAIHEESVESIESRPIDGLYPAVLSLTAPTGAGKTLTALGCALRLRERVSKEHGHLPRIIYTLPFVNIIEQNSSVIQEVLSGEPDFGRNPSRYLLKSHHLAPPGFRDDEDVETEQALLFAESWESEIVVTTFVSLFESLVTNRNRALKKLHNIAGSIVVLDEIQSIPYEQWALVRHVLITLTEHLGCTVIQMTATRPRILPGASEILKAPEGNFSGLSRTRIVPQPEVDTLEKLTELVEEVYSSERSLLVVLNTIRSSVEHYRMLRERLGLTPYREYGREHRDRYIFYLSTNITPWQRSRRVRLLGRYMRTGGKPLVISTQVVEAGVDLDFDAVIRDQGPLDSIVQVAGRCNRGGKSTEPKPVHVVFLEEDKRRSMAELVYGKILPRLSREALIAPLNEDELYPRIEEYFGKLPDHLQDDFSRGFIHAIEELEFHRWENDRTTVSHYRHIQEEREAVPVLVEINEEAVRAVGHLTALCEDKGVERSALQEAYRATAPFTITPNLNRLKQNPPAEHPKIPNHRYISLAEVRSGAPAYFNLETGFKWEEAAILL